MKRANLKQEFHGEPDMAEEGSAVSGLGPDEVTVDIKGGTLTLRTPSDTPDNRVMDDEYLEQYLQLVVELEDGSELTVTLDEDRDGVDVRRESREQVQQRNKSASRPAADQSPRT